ncbi:uncharacterized protein CANTADRAFT_20620 [Suhomyces tanzawaensis NRRL Y-17324]|uniref:Uncharacterized protein n=1 Tax=Suhomyces tanzawaensis NRRL Y-17324 TaxID=984487 RepID=A0A1E4SNI2_9ASCO|nr:uncharacterized protein CANTADRAFT_20620 [Suhomyces tanzawaensis NRRL Y-17324]ODV81079.1 hypothetical protein CANTADRAFT_20620 [Suhomyces tanzawaensis NRRL Y-17324]
MHSYHLAIALIASAASVNAADSQQIDFVTRLVQDAKANAKDYLNFIQTAKTSIPAEFTSLAREVQTYKDDSYTTLIDAQSINVSELQSFATALPWYSSRIAQNNGGGSSQASSGASSAAGGSSSRSGSSSSAAASSGSSSQSSSAGIGAMIVPMGATLAGVAVALL